MCLPSVGQPEAVQAAGSGHGMRNP
jgi:hypothetical protein